MCWKTLTPSPATLVQRRLWCHTIVEANDQDKNHFVDAKPIVWKTIVEANDQGQGAKKKIEKKLTSVSFMYVCVAENGEMLVFFSFFFPTIV